DVSGFSGDCAHSANSRSLFGNVKVIDWLWTIEKHQLKTVNRKLQNDYLWTETIHELSVWGF
ncbi:MAG: hypothetical protein KAI86_08915, partial [Desulfobacterales bacterium]|nr:hypothetical protein [Desulfobacterales bacterium]